MAEKWPKSGLFHPRKGPWIMTHLRIREHGQLSTSGSDKKQWDLLGEVVLWKRPFLVVLKNVEVCENMKGFWETGRTRFRGARFQTPNSVSFFGLTEFRGANSVSFSQSFICVPKANSQSFRRTHRVCPKTQWGTVSSLLRNSTLETAFRPLPSFKHPKSVTSFPSARRVLCGDAPRLFLDQISKHLSSVLGWTELCHEIRNPGPKDPNENHHPKNLLNCF